MTGEKSRSRWHHLPHLILLASLLLILLWGGLKVYRLVRLARSLQTRLDAIVEMSSDADWRRLEAESVRDLVHGVRADFVSLEAEIRLWLWVAPAFRRLPGYGPDLVLAPQLMEIGDAGTEAAVAVTEAFLPIWDRYSAGDLALPELVGDLAQSRLQLANAENALARISAARRTIPPAEYSPVTQRALSKLDEMLPLAQVGLRAAQLLPGALGLDGRRTYLLVAQNEDELRPTGGFISSAGLLVMDGGEIADLSFEDSYAEDDWENHAYPSPPLPFRQIMGDGLWLFRDANWSPDWPTSARQAVALYQISRDTPIDGVIAVDQRAVQLLVGPLGPLTLPGHSGPVTSGSVRGFMREAWFTPAQREAGQWLQFRKVFISELAAAMMQKLLSDAASLDPAALFTAVRTALDERDILLYFEDPELAELVHTAGWDGAMRSPPNDYLMVVDANMGFNKSNAIVSQDILYQVSLGDRLEGRVTLTYTHGGSRTDTTCRHEPFYDSTITGYSDLVNGCYWDYVRVFPAAGAQPLGGSAHPLSRAFLSSQRDWIGETVATLGPDDRLSLANLFLLERGGTEEVAFWYRVPASVVRVSGDRSTYRLVVQKQPGTLGHVLRVVIQLPAGTTPLASTPAAVPVGERLIFDLTLTTDQEIIVEWSG